MKINLNLNSLVILHMNYSLNILFILARSSYGTIFFLVNPRTTTTTEKSASLSEAIQYNS